MKKAALLLLIFSGHLPGFSQSFMEEYASQASNPKKIIRKNNIIRERIFSYSLTKKGKKDSALSSSFEYDSMGNSTQITEFTRYGAKVTTIRYEYNPDHSIHRRMMDQSDFSSLSSIQEYVYDSAGNTDQVYTYNADTSSMVIQKNVYDEKRQLITIYTKKGSNDFFLTKRYYYSEDGQSSKEESFNGIGIAGNYNVTEYDSALNKRTFYVESKKGREHQRDFFYDNANRCIRYAGELTEIPKNGSPAISHPMTERFTYNPDGTVFECYGMIDNKDQRIFRHYYMKQ